ncbi:hypothetical protein TNCV_3780691, partial [Trichonephila clavipes]
TIRTKGIRREQHEAYHSDYIQPVVQPLMEDWFPVGDGIYQDGNATPYRSITVQTCCNHSHGCTSSSEMAIESPHISVIKKIWEMNWKGI